jgi:hypothetical protein
MPDFFIFVLSHFIDQRGNPRGSQAWAWYLVYDQVRQAPGVFLHKICRTMDTETFQKIFDVFKSHFPAASRESYTLKLTSTELFQTFSRFYPGEFSEKELFDKMILEGYQYSPENRSGTISFAWLLRENKSLNLG